MKYISKRKNKSSLSNDLLIKSERKIELEEEKLNLLKVFFFN